MAYKLFSASEGSNTDESGNHEKGMSRLKKEFPVLEEQIQLKGRLTSFKYLDNIATIISW